MVNGDDPSQVEIELQLVNTSSYLFGFHIYIKKAEGSESIQWKQIGQYWNYLDFEDYLDVILANLEVPAGQNINDIDFFSDYLDVKANIQNDRLLLKEELWVPSGIFYPVLEEPTAVGRICLDMSACEDGEYELRADNTQGDCAMSYIFPQGYHIWIMDESLVFTLVKQGNSITELRSIPATFAPPAVTGISTVAADKADNRIFDLQGRELQGAPEHGIYIQNGKKYLK
ncbi:MAG: hypothetical protein J6X22_01780 [Muribaculaceae bacterium]|nr:hypothetical protein [Muribaculaceae bacterium]